MKKHVFLNRAAFGPMTASERRLGRYLRAPEGHEGGDGGGSGGGGSQMDIPTSVDSLDALPVALRPFYIEKDGKHVLDDIQALRGTVTNIKNENRSIKGRLSQYSEFDGLGLTIEEVKQLKQARDDAATQRAKDEGDFTALKDQMETNHQNEINTYKSRETKLLGTVQKLLVDDAARAVLAEKDVEGNPTLLLPLIRDRVKVTETDDGFLLEVLREDGVPMLNSQNKAASLKDLFLEMKGREEFAGAFKGSGQSGGGAPTGQGGQGGGAPGSMKRSEMSNAQKAVYIKQHGQDAYFKLPA